MLTRLVKKVYPYIISQAALFNPISKAICVDAIVLLLREMKCAILINEAELKDRVTLCLEALEFLSGPEALDGELASLLLLRLDQYLSLVKQSDNPFVNIDWNELQRANERPGKIVTAATTITNKKNLLALKAHFDNLKVNGKVIIDKNSIDRILMPIILNVAKITSESAISNTDIQQFSRFQEMLVSVLDLSALDRLYLKFISLKIFYDHEMLANVYEKYLRESFLPNLTSLAFYPQPRTYSLVNESLRLKSADVVELSKDPELSALHQSLLDLVRQIGWVDFSSEHASLQGSFLSLYFKFQEKVNIKANALIVTKRESRKTNQIPMFIENLKQLVENRCWNYSNDSDPELKRITSMIAKYKSLFEGEMDPYERYQAALRIAQQEALDPTLPCGSYDIDMVFRWHAAICIASSECLVEMVNIEKNIVTFVKNLRKFLDAPCWHHAGTVSDEYIKMTNMFASYREMLDESLPARVQYRRAVVIANLGYSLASGELKNSIFRLPLVILNGQVGWLIDMLAYQDMVADFIGQFKVFLNDDCWKHLNLSDSENHAFDRALIRYREICNKGLFSGECYETLCKEANEMLDEMQNPRNNFFKLQLSNSERLLELHHSVRKLDADRFSLLLVEEKSKRQSNINAKERLSS